MLKVRVYRFMVGLMWRLFWLGKVPKHVKRETRRIPVAGGEIRAHVYSPEGEGPFPVMMYFHGGGFVLGNIDEYDPLCRDLCDKTRHTVVSVDYRLAPEQPFPVAAEDCIAALDWLKANITSINGKPDTVVVAGDSAGGNLAAVVALQARDKYPDWLAGQVLIYPVTHHYDYGTTSYTEKATGCGLTRGMMVWFWDCYLAQSPLLPAGETEHELATPLSVKNLAGLPRALVITAEHDPLRDEGIAYAERMAAQGVAVKHSLYAEEKHGFIGTIGPRNGHHNGVAEITSWLSATA